MSSSHWHIILHVDFSHGLLPSDLPIKMFCMTIHIFNETDIVLYFMHGAAKKLLIDRNTISIFTGSNRRQQKESSNIMTEHGGRTIMFLTSTIEVPVSQLDWDIKYLH
jgi:hypothetical protein